MHPCSREYLDGEENLPLYYGEDYLVLLPRDPYWLYTYWEVSIPTREHWERELNRSWDTLGLTLRVHRYDIANTGKESHFDIQISPAADNWYIKVGVPDKKYQIELGCHLPEGFHTFLLSNVVTTPRDRLSDIIDENWRLPDWQARRLYWRISRNNLSSLEMVRWGIHNLE